MSEIQAASVSVIVPVLDDAAALAGLLADLAEQRDAALDVIVADGGSRDDAIGVARAHGARWVAVDGPGRARQMNAGAAHATGDWLLFLHADSRLSDRRQIAEAVASLAAAGEHAAGHFALTFARGGSGCGRFYRFMEAKSASNRRYSVNGDQGLLLTARFFGTLGGFPVDDPPLEDQRMIAAILRLGQCRLLPHRLLTSARRFEAGGEARVYARMALTMAMYSAVVPAYFERAPERGCLADDARWVRNLTGTCGARAGWRVCRRLAAIAVGETWQLALALDVACNRSESQPASRLYQRCGRWLLENRLVIVLLAAGLMVAVWSLLRLWYALANPASASNKQ